MTDNRSLAADADPFLTAWVDDDPATAFVILERKDILCCDGL